MKPHPRNESSKYAPIDSFWGYITSPILLATGSYALALGRDTKAGHHALVRPDSRRENLIFCTIHNFIHGTSIVLLVWRSIMFTGSFLRVCRILQFVKKKLDFAFLSLGRPSHGARVWCLGRVPKHRNHWQEVEGSGKK